LKLNWYYPLPLALANGFAEDAKNNWASALNNLFLKKYDFDEIMG